MLEFCRRQRRRIIEGRCLAACGPVCVSRDGESGRVSTFIPWSALPANGQWQVRVTVRRRTW
jgi:hypothetical protein